MANIVQNTHTHSSRRNNIYLRFALDRKSKKYIFFCFDRHTTISAAKCNWRISDSNNNDDDGSRKFEEEKMNQIEWVVHAKAQRMWKQKWTRSYGMSNRWLGQSHSIAFCVLFYCDFISFPFGFARSILVSWSVTAKRQKQQNNSSVDSSTDCMPSTLYANRRFRWK